MLASLPDSKRAKLLGELTPAQKAMLRYDWKFWARPKQRPPSGPWTIWVVLAGRGFGKTRTGAEYFREVAETRPNGRGMLLGMTPADARDVMVRGSSGILSVCPPWNYPNYEPSKNALTWPNGFKAHIRSAHAPDKVRGPEQELLWADEVSAWPAKKGKEAWDNAMLGLRVGERPQAIVTMTPKPIPLVKEILDHPSTVRTSGSTYENRANLAPSFYETVLKRYEGTNLGRQEIYAELLEEAENALWKRSLIDKHRVKEAPDFVRGVVGVDPSGGVVETGIVGAGIAKDGHVYVVADASDKATPAAWGRAVLGVYTQQRLGEVVGEKNFGGDMVQHVIESAARERGQTVRYKHVIASRGKIVRAEPVVALYEQGRVHHVGTFPQLEAEMTMWVPGEPSPNRLDALVWAITELAIEDLKPVKEVEVMWG